MNSVAKGDDINDSSISLSQQSSPSVDESDFVMRVDTTSCPNTKSAPKVPKILSTLSSKTNPSSPKSYETGENAVRTNVS